MELTDTELIEAVRAGDEQALTALLSRHAPRIYRYGLKMCRDPEDARDVVQDTLLAAARGVRDFRGASSLSTWLYAVARSFCLRKRRGAQAAPNTCSLEDETDVEETPSLESPPDEAVAHKELGAALDAAITALDPMYREVLVLRDVEGLTAPEVAEVLGLTVDAVKTRLHRARAGVGRVPGHRGALLALPRRGDRRRGVQGDGAPRPRLQAMRGGVRQLEAHARPLPRRTARRRTRGGAGSSAAGVAWGNPLGSVSFSFGGPALLDTP